MIFIFYLFIFGPFLHQKIKSYHSSLTKQQRNAEPRSEDFQGMPCTRILKGELKHICWR